MSGLKIPTQTYEGAAALFMDPFKQVYQISGPQTAPLSCQSSRGVEVPVVGLHGTKSVDYSKAAASVSHIDH